MQVNIKKEEIQICKISIVTATYNREKYLLRLYKSIKKQSFKDFEWVIVDDGSTDNTKVLINKLKQENLMKIKYFYKKNGGKHTALNLAIEKCSGELFFIMDSDDVLTENSLAKIIEIDKKVLNKENYCGIAGLMKNEEGKNLSKDINVNEINANSIDAIYKYGLFGDKAEVFYTEILKKYRFKVFENEKFLTEATLWNEMARDGYIIRWTNIFLATGCYLDGGLTKKSFQLFLENPKGHLYYLLQLSTLEIPMKYKIKTQSNYFRFGLLAGYKINDLQKNIQNNSIKKMTIIIGYLGYIYTKIRKGIV